MQETHLTYQHSDQIKYTSLENYCTKIALVGNLQ